MDLRKSNKLYEIGDELCIIWWRKGPEGRYTLIDTFWIKGVITYALGCKPPIHEYNIIRKNGKVTTEHEIYEIIGRIL